MFLLPEYVKQDKIYQYLIVIIDKISCLKI